MDETYTVYQDANGNVLTIVDTTTWESFNADPQNLSYQAFLEWEQAGGVPTIVTQ